MDEPPTARPVEALLATDLVTPATRAALRDRLAEPADDAVAPRALAPDAWATLRAAAARLVPQPDGVSAVPLAASVDARLAAGAGDGWRYDALPPDPDAYRRGLAGLDDTARALHGAAFAALAPEHQDVVLAAVRAGDPPGDAWRGPHALDAARWFEEVLAELTERYVADPRTQAAMGYAGMADARGWDAVGLGARAPWEPPADQGAPSGTTAAALPAPLPNAPSTPPLPADPGLPPWAATMRRHDPDGWVDVVVVGTGAGGAPVLARLAAAGLKVVALEAGRWWTPERDFATDERAQADLFWRDERLSAGADPLAFGSNNSGTGVGGSTLHFTAYTPRPHPDDFRLRTDFGAGADWPLGYDDLAPYLDEVEWTVGVSGPTPYPWGPARPRGYPLPPLPLNGAAELMARGAAALGIRTSPAANAALSAAYDAPGVGPRRACTSRGFCQAGCSVGAKGSADRTYIPLALGAGAEVRPGCFVTRVETDARGRACGVVYTQDGPDGAGTERRQRCRAVFLCAGAIETPRLLLLNGLANGSGQVGRHFMAHTGLQLWARFEEPVRPFKGIPGGLISEDTHRPQAGAVRDAFGDADFAGGYLLQSIGVMPVTYASQFARGTRTWGAALTDHVRRYNHVAGINILGESLPDPGNYLELANERDARGLPKPRVHFSAAENDRRMTAHADRVLRAVFDAAGARDVWAFPRFAHTIGTCRMGASAAGSVVDRDGRAWDVPGLYVVDHSVFPSAQAVNPALTIMALALRAADRFVAAVGRGEAGLAAGR